MIQGGRAVDQPITDPVTGTYSRALLLPRLDEELERAGLSAGSCALFLFDVDFFKTVNDAYGHLRGDEVLRQLADRVKGLIRGYDSLFRYGGDEFVLLLPGTERAAAVRLALRLTEEIRSREFGEDPPLHLSISLGVASYPEDGTDATALLAVADRRNYLAKRRGRGGAVADDAETTGPETGSARLWERDTPLAITQEFFTRLDLDGWGALRVGGEPGSGHSRFLDEVASIGRMRGFTVLAVPPAPAPPPPAPLDVRRLLLIVDLGATDRTAEAVAALRATHPDAALGVAYADTGRPGGGGEPPLPLLGDAELLPWSPATLKIWLRNTLQGEPNRALVTWLMRDSGGLPARAARGLARLRDSGGLVATAGGGWTLAPAMLGRPRRRSRLPVPMTPLMGRTAERERVCQLLAGGRLVTLVGPGGIGKTRLSLAAAAAAAEDFEDGAVFVPLADATDPALVVAAIAHAVHVTEVPGQPLLDSVVEHLAEASMLLVLDNFEQVLRAGTVVAELLGAAPGVSALVTSRERLSLYGEQVYHVPPLPLPDLDALPAGAAGVARALADSPAMALFEQRASAASGDFALSTGNLAAVAQLCRRLDGLPLAIELAAARVDRWSPDALLEHLVAHLDALGEGPADLPARQQTLRGAIDWSFVLLEPADQRVFVALSAFAGGWTVDAAAAVAGPAADAGSAGDGPAADGAEGIDLVTRLDRLTGKSLLAVDTEAGEVRYRMLETIRAYAMARLDADADADAVRDRHRAYFVDFAGRSGAGMAGPEQAAWAERLERDYQNLRTAIAWALDRGDAASAAEVCLGLWRYWRTGSHLREGREWLDRVLAAGEDATGPARVGVLYAAAVLATNQDEHDKGYRLAGESLRLAEAAGDRAASAQAHNALGIAAIGSGDYHVATEHFQQTLAIWRELDNGPGTAIALGNLTKLALRLGDIDGADSFAAQCLTLERAADNPRGISLALECIGQIRLAQGRIVEAREALGESLSLNQTLGDAFGEAMAQHQLGLAAYAEGDRIQALALLTTALGRRFEVGDREDLAVSLECVAHVMADADPPFAATLLGAAEELRERRRLPAPPEADTRREATLTALRAALDPQAFASAVGVGRTAPLDLIVDEALDLAPAA
ncbi:MAG TPA: diguanylate cyclase [Pilimelia sp.]|nr:diguanylate cyclase [Pilimelia sp.]